MRAKLHGMPHAAVLHASARDGALQHHAADGSRIAAQLPSGIAVPAHTLCALPPQPEETLAVDVDLSKPILKQVLLIEGSA